MWSLQMSEAARTVVDEARRGYKGFPMHAEALGIDPPMKTVPFENGEPQTEHPGMTLQEYAASKRWEKEIGGIVVNGIPVATDDRSKIMITGIHNAAKSDPEFTTRWKCPDGSFVEVDAANAIAIGEAVLTHIACCFAVEESVQSELAAGWEATYADIDVAFERVHPFYKSR